MNIDQWWGTFLPPRATDELRFPLRAAQTTLAMVHLIFIHIKSFAFVGLAGSTRIACGPLVAPPLV